MVLAAASITYLAALKLRDNTLADALWGPQQVLIAATVLTLKGPPYGKFTSWTLVGMLVLWALRLTGYLLARRGPNPKEDKRYAQMRQQWGRAAPIHSLFKIFYLQALFALVLSLPVMSALSRSTFGWQYAQTIGLCIWGWGLVWETLGDWQLMRFKQGAPKEAIMREGVWRYSRHPNYTGEVLVWWGIYLFTGSWAMIVSPALITILIARVSGVPLAEKRYEGNRAYEEYKRHTPALIPRFLLPLRSR